MEAREVSLRWPIGTSEPELERLINQLTVRIEEVAFARTPDGYEIQARMAIANRSFLSTWVVGPDDTELRAAFESMLGRVDRQAVREMEAFLALGRSNEAASSPTAPGNVTVQPLRKGA
jgi:hypothetical protein